MDVPELYQNCTDKDILRQIEEAISRARLNGSSTDQDSSSGSSSSEEEDRELSLVLSDIGEVLQKSDGGYTLACILVNADRYIGFRQCMQVSSM